MYEDCNLLCACHCRFVQVGSTALLYRYLASFSHVQAGSHTVHIAMLHLKIDINMYSCFWNKCACLYAHVGVKYIWFRKAFSVQVSVLQNCHYYCKINWKTVMTILVCITWYNIIVVPLLESYNSCNVNTGSVCRWTSLLLEYMWLATRFNCNPPM